MSRSSVLIGMLPAFVLAAGCFSPDSPDDSVGQPLPPAIASLSPHLEQGKKGGDEADRSCRVVLRYAGRNPGGPDFETDCSTGNCLYVWRGAVDVAGDLPAGARVHVLYRHSSDPQWWEVPADPAGNGLPGFSRHAFAVSEHLFGPATPGHEGLAVEMAAFVRFADGGRLFDHNTFPGDYENARLDASTGFGFNAGSTCEPVMGTLWFGPGYNQSTSGYLRRDGWMEVHYDIDRLPDCRGTHNGYPAWDIVAHARFLPGGQEVSGSVRQLGNKNGTPTNDAVSVPFVTRIPADAAAVQLWFHNFSGAGSSCQAWDSNYGSNYYFEVLPQADDPKCKNVEKETGAHTEDYRMAHNQPYCLSYDISAQYDADHCEFWVDGFGDGYVGHYGIPFHWLLAYLKVGPQQGQVLNVGMYTAYHDTKTGEAGHRFSLGIEEAPGTWRAGFAYKVTGFQSVTGCDFVVDTFAFFLDVRRPGGEVVRLWQSRHGANYRLDDAFGLPMFTENIPYGKIRWASAEATVFDSRAACQ